MNVSNIISVDPAKKTLGEQHPEFTAEFLRNTVVCKQAETQNSHKLLNVLFGSSSPSANRFAGYMLMFRAMFSSLLIVSGAFILSGEILAPASPLAPEALAIGEISVGALLCAGLLTRYAALASTALFLVMTIQSIIAGVFNVQAMMLLYASIGFLVMGAGKYSCDSAISKAFRNYMIRRRERRRQERLSYKAFRNAI